MHCLRVWMQGPLVCKGWETPVTFNRYQCWLTFWLVVLFDISCSLWYSFSHAGWKPFKSLMLTNWRERNGPKRNNWRLTLASWPLLCETFLLQRSDSLIHGRIIEANLPSYNICDLLFEGHWHWDAPQETCILRNKELVKNIALAIFFFLCALDTEKAVERTTCKYYIHCWLSLTVWKIEYLSHEYS